MAVEVEFGDKETADAVRDEYLEHLCSDDDRRLMTVTFSDDAPEGVLDQARARADESLATETRRSQTSDLSEGEREKISRVGGFEGPATVFSWESAKGVFSREGEMSHWSDAIASVADYEDPIEGAEQWIKRFRETGGSFGSEQNRGEQDIRQSRRMEQAAKTAQGQCNHAKGHCENGDSEACEYLKTACGYSDEEVSALMSEADQEAGEDEITGQAAGAMKQAWQGYKAGISQVDEAIGALDTDWENAQQAARAINSIRQQHGQDPLHFERLEELQADLLELRREMAADCHECHAHHEHDHPETDTSGQRAESDGGEVKPIDGPEGWDGPEETDGTGVRWRYDRPRRDGGTVMLQANPQKRGNGWEVTAGYLDELEAVPISVEADRSAAIARANGWLQNQGADPPADPDAVVSIYERDRAGGGTGAVTNSEKLRHVSDTDAPIERDPQRDLSGGRVEEQTQLAGGETGERGQGEIEAEAKVERNPGGIMADERGGGLPDEEETEQEIPEAFRTAEGGQETL